jgi:hypothetical protein
MGLEFFGTPAFSIPGAVRTIRLVPSGILPSAGPLLLVKTGFSKNR